MNIQIIDEKTLIQAEQGNNYLNPDDFMFLCEAESFTMALKKYCDELKDIKD